jgi:hypothetical protein
VISISVALYQLLRAPTHAIHVRAHAHAPCTHSNTTQDSIMLPAPTTSSAYLTRGGGKRRINDPPPLFALSRSERVGTSARAYMRERSRTRTPHHFTSLHFTSLHSTSTVTLLLAHQLVHQSPTTTFRTNRHHTSERTPIKCTHTCTCALNRRVDCASSR